MEASIEKIDLNTEAGEIESRLQGNRVAIKIIVKPNSQNEFTLSSEASFFGNSPGYRRKLNNLVQSLCYPEEE